MASDTADDRQPAIPETPATPAAGGADQPAPPSRVLNNSQQPGSVGRADMDQMDLDSLRRQRDEDINPSRAREEGVGE
ncbi:hypothetical protein HHL28_13265 [Aerophototrophica crusticola]|uniref:Uncharacterized protein n=1 Tax=Aerophototrophica crusticola TaxID=1709002 RepID=A0A858R9V9_9PROT|nr:hypothetical protein HHL28_13265 [Rhodospirillaceae bacterium B3]